MSKRKVVFPGLILYFFAKYRLTMFNPPREELLLNKKDKPSPTRLPPTIAPINAGKV